MSSCSGITRIAIFALMLAVFGLRSIVPAGYMVGANEDSDSLIIELCSGTDTKFVRVNFATGESEIVDPSAPQHDDDEPQSAGVHCISTMNGALDRPRLLDWQLSETFARAQSVVVMRRLAIAIVAGLPPLPARGPPLKF